MLHAPMFHVNADDPDAAVQAARLAVGYRQQFRSDTFIHFVCYRRHGHNELDDPTLTQPVMYGQDPRPPVGRRAVRAADGRAGPARCGGGPAGPRGAPEAHGVRPGDGAP